ncbi:iron-sulfur cluster assembly protein [Salinisphaera sp.]|uniref:iron-sulfur cluster assembly protein n=1 Tax=Salinisphaera sp. TaxID=1914330 RepID=UPI002D76DF36|nr:iron-sulfur cluster assembly protein [Salinisphaera sp.]HET7314213.1 iron-sulfur cluster assembly protein [Salinisphaera sp.]
MNAEHRTSREAEVWAAIGAVTDPELDRSVTELGFIARCDVDARTGDVAVEYRLPTYWCAANFAFMMGYDMAERLDELAWVRETRVRLLDHFYAAEINRGLAGKASFQDTCGAEASGDLVELRATFRHKAFMARQERLLSWLIRTGAEQAALVAWTVADLAARPMTDARGERLRERYLAMRREGTPGDFSGAGYRGDAREIAFVTATGGAIALDGLDAHRRKLQAIRMNSEFNATLCGNVLAARKRSNRAGDETLAGLA